MSKKFVSKELDYEVTEGNIFEALGRERSEDLLARAKLLHQVSELIKKSGLSRAGSCEEAENFSTQSFYACFRKTLSIQC